MAQAMKIAIIDDEQDMRQSISQWLALSGFETETFASAGDALKGLSADYPGIIVTDIKMPGMDGMQFLRKVKGIDSNLPVIMITGHGDVPMAVEAMRIGAFDFLEKPFQSRYDDRLGQERRRGRGALVLGQSATAPRAIFGQLDNGEARRRQWRHGAIAGGYFRSGAGGWPCADRGGNRHGQNPRGPCAACGFGKGPQEISFLSCAGEEEETIMRRLFGPAGEEDRLPVLEAATGRNLGLGGY